VRQIVDGLGDLGTVLFTLLCAVWLIDSVWEWHEWWKERRKPKDHSHGGPID
jgi:hypothetical protein